MATDQERLLLVLEAQTKAFERALSNASSVADKEAARIEARFRRMNQQAARDFSQFQNQVRGVLAALGVGLAVREATQLGDVWTRVGNRLVTAGVASDRLATTQQLVADIALRTRSNLEATGDLFARMLRSSEDLGANMSDVAAATELVNKALSGASQSERVGAIRQLGQGLGSGRLQGDELRSILENSRPIAEAIAKEFDTTVGQLRILGKQGELESRRVFQAILRAAPEIEEAFKKTNATIEDSFTNLQTQAARYIGTNEKTSKSLNALRGLINFVANDFGTLADATIVAAAVIGGTFAGIAVAKAINALRLMIAEMVVAGTRAQSLQAALTFFGGSLGIALAAAGAGMAYLATQTDVFTSHAQRIQEADDSLYSALQVIASLETATGDATEATGELADEAQRAAQYLDETATATDDVANSARNAEGPLSAQARAARDLAIAEKERAIATINTAIAGREALIADEQRTQALRRIQILLNSDAATGSERGRRNQERFRADIERSEEEVKRLEERIRFLQGTAARIESGELVTPSRPTRPPRDDPTGDATKRRQQLEDLDRAAQINLARLQHQQQLVDLLEDEDAIVRRTSAYESAGLATAAARAKAEAQVRAEREAINADTQRQIQLSELQRSIDLARVRGQQLLGDALSDQLQVQTLTAEYMERFRLDQDAAARKAGEFVDAMREASEIERSRGIELGNIEHQLDIARALGDERAEQSARRRLAIEHRIDDLRSQGFEPEIAAAQARAEIAELERADLQGRFRQWFGDGAIAALHGEFGDFLEDTVRERFEKGLRDSVNSVADILFDIGRKMLSGLLDSNASSGLGGILTRVLGTALGFGNEVSAASAAVTAAKAGEVSASTAVATANRVATSAALALASALRAAAGASAVSGGDSTAKLIIGSLLSGFTGGSRLSGGDFPFGGFRAAGGPIEPGFAYQLHRDEIVVPRTPQYVIPKGMLSGGMTLVYNDNSAPVFTGTQAEFLEFERKHQRDIATRQSQFVAHFKNAVSRRLIR